MTPQSTFDRSIATTAAGRLTIIPLSERSGAHFSGFVTQDVLDLTDMSVTADVKPAIGATTLFAAAVDDTHWVGFRMEGDELAFESHSGVKTVSRKTRYHSTRHRFLRLRSASASNLVIWETSADGSKWTPEYVATADMAVDAVRIAVSAGTTRAVVAGPATFDHVRLEAAP